MRYEDFLNIANRKKIELVKIKLDKKEFDFISCDIEAETARKYFPARPYLKNVSDLPTEISETTTIVKRVKINLLDEVDADFSATGSSKGHYWRKWVAKNRYYKGRIVEIYDGFDGLEIGSFKQKFVGKIEGIQISNNSVTIEAIDLLSKLSDIKYPLASTVEVTERVPRVCVVNSDEELTSLNAELGDYAKLTTFNKIDNSHWGIEVTSNGYEEYDLPEGWYYIRVIGYDVLNRPISKLDHAEFVPDDSYIIFRLGPIEDTEHCDIYIKYSWQEVKGEYKYLGSYKPVEPYLEIKIKTMPTEVVEMPNEAENYKYLNNADASVRENWVQLTTPMNIEVNEKSSLDEAGYIQLEKEIIKYTSLSHYYSDSILYTVIENVKRMQFGTEGKSHYAKTTVKALFDEVPQNPFTLLIKMLKKANVAEKYIDEKFYEYENTWDGLKFSTKVIVEETTLAKIYFDLVNILDCISWVGEDGKIKIKKLTEIPTKLTEITDDANIIENSAKVDLTGKENFTRWFIYWNRLNVEEGIDKTKSYSRVRVLVDADAESLGEYNEVISKKYTSTWINLDGNAEDEIVAYLDDFLEKRRQRSRDPRFVFECELEMKDSEIEVGDVIELTTKAIETADGEPIKKKKVRVLSKRNKKNKFIIKTMEIK